MNKTSTSPANQSFKHPGFLILIGILAVTLGLLFARSFIRNQVLFSNDGPLGIISSEATRTSVGALCPHGRT